MKKLWTYTLEDSLYNTDTTICVGPFDEWVAHVSHNHPEDRSDPGPPPEPGEVIAKSFWCGLHHYIWIGEWWWSWNRISMLSHECSHVAFDVLTYAGIKLRHASFEAFTYYQQALLYYALIALESRFPRSITTGPSGRRRLAGRTD